MLNPLTTIKGSHISRLYYAIRTSQMDTPSQKINDLIPKRTPTGMMNYVDDSFLKLCPYSCKDLNICHMTVKKINTFILFSTNLAMAATNRRSLSKVLHFQFFSFNFDIFFLTVQ